jgi:hypothetical protein
VGDEKGGRVPGKAVNTGEALEKKLRYYKIKKLAELGGVCLTK